jgi:hypothetical protein
MNNYTELIVFKSHPRFKDYNLKKKKDAPKPPPGDVSTQVHPDQIDFRDMSWHELIKFVEKHKKIFEHYGLKIDTDKYYGY